MKIEYIFKQNTKQTTNKIYVDEAPFEFYMHAFTIPTLFQNPNKIFNLLMFMFYAHAHDLLTLDILFRIWITSTIFLQHLR